MPPSLLILGTSHKLQCGGANVSASETAAFEKELLRICVAFNVGRIAEEMSDVGLAMHEVLRTTGAAIAERLGLVHQYIDLNSSERAALSLGDHAVVSLIIENDFQDEGASLRRAFGIIVGEVRERIWVGRILEGKKWPVLLVCGADHSLNIEKLWGALGFEVTVVHQDYEP
jgi:hypothetical protein